MRITTQIEEAERQLSEAVQALEDQDVAIQALADDTPDETVEFHDSLFQSRKADVDRCKQTLERLIAIQNARNTIPPLRDADDDDDSDGQHASGGNGGRPRTTVKEPLVYTATGRHSYFRDLAFAALQEKRDPEAAARLELHGRQVVAEKRDVTTADPGAASFIPPLYMGADWIDIAVAGRPFADALPKIPLPARGKTMDFPRVTTSPTAAVQAAEGNAVNEVDFDGETYSVPKVTIAGQNDVSIQTLEFADPSIDTVIMRELLKSYNQQLDFQLIYGSGSSGQHRGVKTVVVSDSGNTESFSSGSGAAMLGKIYSAISQVATNAPGYEANAILLHPRRAAWLASHRDANGNLFQQGQLFLAAGGQDMGFVGNVAGLRTIRDSNIAVTQGSGTNEDDAYVLDLSELMLAEGDLRTRVLQEVLSGTLQVRIQLYAFSAFAGGRRPKVITRISGAGLATPTFPSS